MNRRGFTLIELLVVIAIIGILAAMFLGSFAGAQARSRDASRKNDLAQIKSALEAYNSANGVYPAASNTTLSAAISGTHTFKGTCGTNNNCQAWSTVTPAANVGLGVLTGGTSSAIPSVPTAVNAGFPYGYTTNVADNAFTLTGGSGANGTQQTTNCVAGASAGTVAATQYVLEAFIERPSTNTAYNVWQVSYLGASRESNPGSGSCVWAS